MAVITCRPNPIKMSELSNVVRDRLAKTINPLQIGTVEHRDQHYEDIRVPEDILKCQIWILDTQITLMALLATRWLTFTPLHKSTSSLTSPCFHWDSEMINTIVSQAGLHLSSFFKEYWWVVGISMPNGVCLLFKVASTSMNHQQQVFFFLWELSSQMTCKS